MGTYKIYDEFKVKQFGSGEMVAFVQLEKY